MTLRVGFSVGPFEWGKRPNEVEGAIRSITAEWMTTCYRCVISQRQPPRNV